VNFEIEIKKIEPKVNRMISPVYLKDYPGIKFDEVEIETEISEDVLQYFVDELINSIDKSRND
jgi:hypothetical protein